MPGRQRSDEFSVLRPVVSVVAVVVFASVLWLLWQPSVGDQVPRWARRLLSTALLVGAVVGAVRVVGDALLTLERHDLATPHQIEAAYRFLQMGSYGGVLIVTVVSIWEVSVTNVILGAGVTSVVVALAARQTLTSVFAGVSLFSTDVFRVGDWVKIDNRFGQIDRMTLFNTMMRSPQGETHVIPNDEVITRDITNLGKGRYRNDVLVGIDYETDIDRARVICDEVLEELTADRSNAIDGYHPTTVKDFDDSQITLAVKMWVEEPRPMVINHAQTEVLSTIQEAFDAEGISIPFPQRTISDRDSR